jgi:hypothetical protein
METSDPLPDPDIVRGRSLSIGQGTRYRDAGSLGVYPQMFDHMPSRYAGHHISG